MDTLTLTTDRFRAMNTDIIVSLTVEPHPAGLHPAFRDARSWFAYSERTFSRFRPDSELSGLNLASGLPVKISRTMEEVLLLARHYQRWTGGLFNPGILPQLIQAGYSLSFERLPKAPAGGPGKADFESASGEREEPGPGSWKLFGPLQAVRLDKETQIDLGGIVKGWTVDRLTGWMTSKGITAGLINAGGDLRVWGDADTPEWEIEIDDSRQPGETISAVSLRNGAVATSSVLGRRWMTKQGPRHHLIDPRTGKPAETDVLQCTVAGRWAAECEIAAKTVCLLGSQEGLRWLAHASPDSDALVMTRDGGLKLHRSASPGSGRVWKGA
ncbi:FAD:protein FMN transferase [Cohnella caldifontis]|uniref:FAD:protein FMN transferase n=1 Tax=Cohnella caldifontis TaxID=3027471 RepID=UPI0023EB5936|nr:FAD:protein FMN transferase [Cohnella sp. YIM B05605]